MEVGLCARHSPDGARDFDDILLDFLALMEGDREVMAAISSRFSHILVDEFQDVNAVQYKLIKAISGDGKGLFVIGDPDQAIYGFRGADPAYFRQLIQDYPESQNIQLQVNYRMTRQLNSAAAGVISAQEGGQRKPIVAVREGGTNVRLLLIPSELSEGIAVVREINRLTGGVDLLQAHGDGGRIGDSDGSEYRSFGDFAVLFRTGRQSEILADCFDKEGLPYRVVGKKGILDSVDVQKAITFFQYVLNPGDDVRLLNALTLPEFDPGKVELAELRRTVRKGGVPENLPIHSREKLDALVLEAERFRALAEEEPPESLLVRWGNEFDVEDEADFDFFCRFASGYTDLNLALDMLLLGMDADFEGSDGRKSPEKVTLMTLHASKGLEFPVVFICGVEDALIPFREMDAIFEEERRLFYVGLTRAKDEVVLLSARTRMRYGERIQRKLSPFVSDIPEDDILFESVDSILTEKADQLSLW